MCGVVGMIGPRADIGIVRQMMTAVQHRGPDDEGLWKSTGVCLGHKRLSVIDLKSGNQPIHNEDKSLWIVYNGEIYNFRHLRLELESKGHGFYTRTDTEVILHLYEEYGTDSFARLNGMFSFAIWDERKQCALLVRDRFGVKPLHYHWDGATLCFGSEIKVLLSDPSIQREINPQAFHDFLNLRYVPGEQTLFKSIYRLPPAHFLSLQGNRISLQRYWSLPVDDSETCTITAWSEKLRECISSAVDRQMVSDVPLGIYLSGGLDSSSLVAAASKRSNGILKTFSLGFNEPTDELDDGRLVARHFQTSHHEISLDLDPLQFLPEVIWHVEEPKVNILQGYLLARFARQEVKVVLSGLGGDELFAGYDILRFIAPLEGLQPWIPKFIADGPLEWISRAAYSVQEGSNSHRWQQHRLGIQWLASTGRRARMYSLLRNAWDYNGSLQQKLYGPAMRELRVRPIEAYFERYFANNSESMVAQTLRAEFETKMVNDFLLSEDRVSMANGLEVRVPFLDNELVNLAWRIPTKLKYQQGRGKYILKMAMSQWLPQTIIDKRKWGFTFSSYHQFLKDLKAVAEGVLTRERVETVGWFNYAWIRQIIDYPPHPRLRWHYFMLWMMVGFEIWRQTFLITSGAKARRTLAEYYG
jgi:asparagine synthase (glutamine-hydrolysing)